MDTKTFVTGPYRNLFFCGGGSARGENVGRTSHACKKKGGHPFDVIDPTVFIYIWDRDRGVSRVGQLTLVHHPHSLSIPMATCVCVYTGVEPLA